MYVDSIRAVLVLDGFDGRIFFTGQPLPKCPTLPIGFAWAALAQARVHHRPPLTLPLPCWIQSETLSDTACLHHWEEHAATFIRV